MRFPNLLSSIFESTFLNFVLVSRFSKLTNVQSSAEYVFGIMEVEPGKSVLPCVSDDGQSAKIS